MAEQLELPNIDDYFDIRTHNGKITVENTNRGTHRTFRIKTQKPDANFAPGERILSLLIGSDNETSYTQFAFIKPATERHPHGRVILWKRYRTEQYEALARVIQYPEHYRKMGCVYHHEGACRVCNQSLTNPKSIREGIGPVCSRQQR